MSKIYLTILTCTIAFFSYGQNTFNTTGDASVGNTNVFRVFTGGSNTITGVKLFGSSGTFDSNFGQGYLQLYGSYIYDNGGVNGRGLNFANGANVFSIHSGLPSSAVNIQFDANGTSYFNSGNLGIGTTTTSFYSGYTGISTNNATNGGFIDFSKGGTTGAVVYGDGNGLGLNGISGIHFLANSLEKMTVLTNGNVGIGTTSPLTKLHINGSTLTGGLNANIDQSNATLGNISYLAGTGQMLIGWNRSAGEGEADFISNEGPGGPGGFAFYNYGNTTTSNTTQTELMRIRGTGEVLIGVSNFTSSQAVGTNKLAVGGGIISDAVTVKLQGSWPDNVFKPAYQLAELKDIKTYIDKNHHLPEIPSEEEVNSNGQNLGEMNKLLLKKVEELTLYLIDRDNKEKKDEDKLKVQQARLDMQQAQIDKLSKAVEGLTNKALPLSN